MRAPNTQRNVKNVKFHVNLKLTRIRRICIELSSRQLPAISTFRQLNLASFVAWIILTVHTSPFHSIFRGLVELWRPRLMLCEGVRHIVHSSCSKRETYLEQTNFNTRDQNAKKTNHHDFAQHDLPERCSV